jgi:hypothetical protein
MNKMAKSHLIVPGVDSTRVKILLGEPDYRLPVPWSYSEETFLWSYSEETFDGTGEIFDVKFKESIVCTTDRYYF